MASEFPANAAHMLSRVLGRWGLGRLAHNTVVSTFWQYARIGTQALWLIAIAHCLGPAGYGSFAGLAGLAIAMSGLSGIGSSLLLLKNVSRDHATLSAQWRKAVFTTLITGVALTVIFCAVASPICGYRVPWPTLALIGSSELLCVPIVNIASFSFQAHERLSWTGAFPACMAASRFFAAAGMWAFGSTNTLSLYTGFHFTASVLVVLFAVSVVQFVLHPSRSRYELTRNDIREGLTFSSIWLTSNTLSELDKTLTLKFADSEVAGIYAAAYRLTSVLTQPVVALSSAVQPRLFRQSGHDSRAERGSLVRRIAMSTAGYGILASLALLLLAGVLPVVLGQAFARSADTVYWLVLVPPFYSLRLMGNTILMTMGRQSTRFLVEIGGIALLIALCVLLVPTFGQHGTAIAVSVTEAFLAACVWAILWGTTAVTTTTT